MTHLCGIPLRNRYTFCGKWAERQLRIAVNRNHAGNGSKRKFLAQKSHKFCFRKFHCSEMAKINFENFGRDLLYNFTGRPKEGPGAGSEADQTGKIIQ